MQNEDLFDSLQGKMIHMVGIKGTGMAAMAEILHARGARLTGSDGKDVFYTDAILKKLGIPVIEEFREENISCETELVIHSAAYSRETNPDLLAAEAAGIPILNYPEALGIFSAGHISCAIAGVHGKTTTTALGGTLFKYLEFPATILVGSQVPAFDNCCTLYQGDKYLLAETCEYRRHFLNFKASNLVITSVEMDHPDYFKDMEDLFDAFVSFGLQLPGGGSIIYCCDDPGTREVISRIKKKREDLSYIPYGTEASGDYGIIGVELFSGGIRFRLRGFDRDFELKIPGEHNVWNAAAVIALSVELIKKEGRKVTDDVSGKIASALLAFTGTRRRSEILGEVRGVLFMDDYAHHPTAVLKTLEGYKAFYKGRRLVVDFMSHTYSRTGKLLEEFGKAFVPADLVILHKIYSSARESNTSGVRGEDLFERVSKGTSEVRYFHEPEEALPYLEEQLKPGDLFVTMGAGDNWKVGRRLFEKWSL